MDSASKAFLLASRALVGVVARSLAAEDVTLPQFRVLVLLTRAQGMSATELANLLEIHPSTATRMCDRLERKGMVARTVDEADRRRVTLEVTSEGSKLVRRVTERRERDIASIASRMTADERRHAVSGLSAFAAAAGEPTEVDIFGWSAE